MLGWIKRRKVRKITARIDQLKRNVAPFHQVLSTLRSEGSKKDYIARVILKDIQDRERAIIRLDEALRKLEGAK